MVIVEHVKSSNVKVILSYSVSNVNNTLQGTNGAII